MGLYGDINKNREILFLCHNANSRENAVCKDLSGINDIAWLTHRAKQIRSGEFQDNSRVGKRQTKC